GLGRADVGIRRDKLLLGLRDVGAAFEERRWQADRHLWSMWLIGQRSAARHAPRNRPQQRADEVLLLLDLTLEIRDLRGGAEDELLRLAHIQQRCCASLRAYFGEAKRFPARRRRSRRDIEIQVEGAKLKVRARH